MEEVDNSLAVVRSVLPVWAPCAKLLLYGIGGFLTGAIAAWAGGRVAIGPIRKLGDVGWTERARVTFPLFRISAAAAAVPAIWIGIASTGRPGPLAATPASVVGLFTMIATYFGSFIVRWHFIREIKPQAKLFATYLRNELITWLFYCPQIFVLLAMWLLLKPEFDGFAIGVIVVSALAYTWLVFQSGLPLLRLIGATSPASERLERIVSECGKRVGFTPKSTWVIRSPVANAMAYGPTQSLIFTDRACDVLSDEELAAITHHELGHLCEPWLVRSARLFGALLILPFGMVVPISGSWGWTGLLALSTGCCVVFIALQTLTFKMEKRADAVGLQHETDEGAYARALEKLYQLNLSPAVTATTLRSHPDLYDRLLAAGVEPSYPRPKPPSKKRLYGGLLLVILSTASLAYALRWAPNLTYRALEGTEHQATWTVILTGGKHSMPALASERSLLGEADEAIAILRVATNYDPDDHHSPAYMATVLANYGRCTESAEALKLAEDRTRTVNQLQKSKWIAQARNALKKCKSKSATGDALMDQE